MVVVIGIDRNHAGTVKPAIRDGHVRWLLPLAPEDRAIVVEDGFAWLPERINLCCGHQHFIFTVAINVRWVHINAFQVGATLQTLIFAELFVEHPFSPKAVRFGFVESHNAVGIVQHVHQRRAILTPLANPEARFDQLMNVINEILLAGDRIEENDTAGPGIAHSTPIAKPVEWFDEGIVILGPARCVRKDFPSRNYF